MRLGTRRRPPIRRDQSIQELGWLYERHNAMEARAGLKAWIERWQGRYAKLVAWVEENIIETLTLFSLPQADHKNMKLTNMLERFNEEIKRRGRVVRIFPNEASCLRLKRALAAEQHETWQEDNRYITMALLKEMKREHLKAAA
jgi:putative transposase